MSAEILTPVEAANLGKKLRGADDGNLLVGSFAAEMVGESYPFSKTMCAIVFDRWSDEDLGRKFVKWCDDGDAKGSGG